MRTFARSRSGDLDILIDNVGVMDIPAEHAQATADLAGAVTR